MRYTTFIGDGDCKAHEAIQQAKRYGPVPVVKEECVGHIKKRVMTHLRALKKKLGTKQLSDGKPIGGPRRLPDHVIDILRTYFGIAVRSNTAD